MPTTALDFFGICFNLGAVDSQDKGIVTVTHTENGPLPAANTRPWVVAPAGFPKFCGNVRLNFRAVGRTTFHGQNAGSG
jgi:hypothetical protein